MKNKRLVDALENMVPCSTESAQSKVADLRARELGYQYYRPQSAELLGEICGSFLPEVEKQKVEWPEYRMKSAPRTQRVAKLEDCVAFAINGGVRGHKWHI